MLKAPVYTAPWILKMEQLGFRLGLPSTLNRREALWTEPEEFENAGLKIIMWFIVRVFLKVAEHSFQVSMLNSP